MGRFTEDMGRLREEIDSERIARHTLISETRQDVAEAAHAFISDLKHTVDTLQADFRVAHADMAQAARSDRNAFLARLGGAVADIRIAAANRQATVRDELAASAAQARAEREEATTVLREEVAALQDGFQQARGVMAMEMRAAGQTFVSGIVGAVADLQRQTTQMVGEFAGERAAGRAAWRGAPAKPAAKAKPPTGHPAQPEATAAKPAVPAAPKAKHKAAPEPVVKAAEKPPEKPQEKPVEKPAVEEPRPIHGAGGGAEP